MSDIDERPHAPTDPRLVRAGQDGSSAADPAEWTCPVPLADSAAVLMGHGGGGAMSAELVEQLFLPAFRSRDGETPVELADAAVLELCGSRIAFTTDSFVVRPLFFPGGSIGDLAVNGTVNDLAMVGARPWCLSTAFILEEGTDLAELRRVADALGTAARAAGVRLVTGDTKVVDAGHGDGIYVNTTGLGLVPDGVDYRPGRAGPGDVVIVSGEIGAHGVAVLSCREGLEFDTAVRSDTRPLHGLVAAMGRAGGDIHALRDPTRGGLAATLNEIARDASVGVDVRERDIPIAGPVADACSILGLDPFAIANEGVLVAMVAAEDADRVLDAMHAHPDGRDAAPIGEVTANNPGVVAARTGLGGERVIDLPTGTELPRIC
ncbi:carbamoyl phosphate phosphatase, hydrogenase 3 maturation protein [Frankia canadensis]|uniref:Carbamoyl phosphate phosphatase, hydrogenase 3 maturation protein n=1 Tax=Frankia canadensis TaxID=1836972 RepID=A0A2I2L2I6_9ACTN|nr:carbamoyl phosphate phosphatase, hydrogenase 3 maturation protein [Frankia canadensis]SOU59433.1 carbamoyl phosphate phosphatase, hydrogenase 3 maturation protein [Frankia canadensis]